MIRFAVSETELQQRIEAEAAGWLKKALTKAKAANASGHVGEGDGIWSEIKGVYMELQGFKCMYCEKPMPKPDDERDGASGKVEYDVEHFRPKNRVTAWPPAKVKARRKIDYDDALEAGVPTGYVWLAFDHLNYGVSCKTCNSELKGDRFPILGKRGKKGQRNAELDPIEKPCLVLPVGANGTNPEDLLGWNGPLVFPKKGLSVEDTLRAKVLIDFFELDTRRDLLEGRCHGIMLLFPRLKEKTAKAKKFVEALTADDATFAGCFRAFVALFKKNKAQAAQWADDCERYVITRGKTGLTAPES